MADIKQDFTDLADVIDSASIADVAPTPSVTLMDSAFMLKYFISSAQNVAG
ncbi:hypothetical protein [Octadecabacter antarcticus]|uniref:hypothetical protein n=1 Tax=Octadecabacter antarcticus TaxID=1217908 RepID=UPI00018063AA|nr:hypothetical protein [Octadecabacter antarcticus]